MFSEKDLQVHDTGRVLLVRYRVDTAVVYLTVPTEFVDGAGGVGGLVKTHRVIETTAKP